VAVVKPGRYVRDSRGSRSPTRPTRRCAGLAQVRREDPVREAAPERARSTREDPEVARAGRQELNAEEAKLSAADLPLPRSAADGKRRESVETGAHGAAIWRG